VDIDTRKPANYWTLEKCQEDALNYRNIKQWRNSSAGYYAAYRNGWIKFCRKHMKRPGVIYWTLEKCKDSALKHKNKKSWMLENAGAYDAARRNGWLILCCTHMIRNKPKGYWTLERCQEDALKYKSRSEWQSYSHGYTVALLHGWLDKCCIHMKSHSSSSKEERELFSKIKEIYPDAKKKRFYNKKEKFKIFELDIYIPSLNVGVEFNGTYWHSFEGLKRGRANKKNKIWSDEDLMNYHQIKRDFFKKKGIEYIEIKEEDWNKDKESCLNNVLHFIINSIT
jgi:hypothetical protein